MRTFELLSVAAVQRLPVHLALTAAIAFGVAFPVVPALAQDDEPGGDTPIEDAPEDHGVVDEIVVTIRKRTENVQDVPASVTGLSARRLEEANVQSIGDAVSLIPNATVKSNGGPISIRGISQSFSSSSPVAQHVNGVFKFAGNAYLGQFYDLQSFDVARGPSGTIYGRNATAGATNLVWRKPNEEFEVFGDATVGNFNRLDFRGGFNAPLFGNGDDRLMTRFVMVRETHDGWVDNLEEPSRRRDPLNADLWHLRTSVQANFVEDVTFDVRGYWTRDGWAVGATRPGVSQFLPGILQLGDGGPEIPSDPYNMPASGPPAKPISPDPREVRSRVTALGDPRTEMWGMDGQLTWDAEARWLGDIELTLLGGVDFQDNVGTIDTDGSELQIVDTLRDDEVMNTTAEFRVSSADDGVLTWMVGFFYYGAEIQRFQSSGTPFGFFDVDRDDFDFGYAPFMNMTWDFLDRFQLFGGFRWNHDEVNRDIVNKEVTLGPFTLREASAVKDTNTFDEPTGEVGLKARYWEDNIVYAKFSRGYKAGNIELLSSGEKNVIDPEIILAVEAGVRNRLWDDRVTLNLTGFWYDYTDLQVPQIIGTNVVTTNAASATLWGIELEAAASPVDNWYISGSVSYLSSEFGEFCASDAAQFLSASDPGCPPPTNSFNGQLDLSGNTPEDSPEWKVTLFTNYDLDFGRWGILTPVLKFTFSDGYFLRPFNCGTCDRFQGIDEVDAYTRTDIRLQWRSEGGGLWGELFVENIEDNSIYSRSIITPEYAGGNPTTLGMQQPRLYGFRMGFTWEGL